MNEHLKNIYCELYDSLSKLDRLLKMRKPSQPHKSGMTNNNIEEIISGLRHCLAGEQYKDKSCKDCPYEDNSLYCREHLYEDAIQALEDYECNAKEWLPTTIPGMVQCPHCKAYWLGETTYNIFFKHCPRCGKRVKEITSEQERE